MLEDVVVVVEQEDLRQSDLLVGLGLGFQIALERVEDQHCAATARAGIGQRKRKRPSTPAEAGWFRTDHAGDWRRGLDLLIDKASSGHGVNGAAVVEQPLDKVV